MSIVKYCESHYVTVLDMYAGLRVLFRFPVTDRFRGGTRSLLKLEDGPSAISNNRPVSYSNGWTGSSMKWRLMRAN